MSFLAKLTALVRALYFIPNPFLVFLCFYANVHILHIYFYTSEVSYLYSYWYISRKIKNIYGVFCILGSIVFFVVASVFLYLPYAHGSEMSPASRTNYFFLGVSINFFFHALPLGWLNLWIAVVAKWQNDLSAVVLIVSILNFFISFAITWYAYSWNVSEFLQGYFLRNSDIEGVNWIGLNQGKIIRKGQM